LKITHYSIYAMRLRSEYVRTGMGKLET